MDMFLKGKTEKNAKTCERKITGPLIHMPLNIEKRS